MFDKKNKGTKIKLNDVSVDFNVLRGKGKIVYPKDILVTWTK